MIEIHSKLQTTPQPTKNKKNQLKPVPVSSLLQPSILSSPNNPLIKNKDLSSGSSKIFKKNIRLFLTNKTKHLGELERDYVLRDYEMNPSRYKPWQITVLNQQKSSRIKKDLWKRVKKIHGSLNIEKIKQRHRNQSEAINRVNNSRSKNGQSSSLGVKKKI